MFTNYLYDINSTLTCCVLVDHKNADTTISVCPLQYLSKLIDLNEERINSYNTMLSFVCVISEVLQQYILKCITVLGVV